MRERRTPFSRILVGVDGSRGGESATRLGGELALAGGGEVLLVHAVPLPPIIVGVDQAISEESLSYLETTAEHSIRAGEAILDEIGAPHENVVKPGSAGDVILDVADERGVDLIVVGHRGLGAVRRIVFGSVSAKVAHHARCAVLLAPVEEG